MVPSFPPFAITTHHVGVADQNAIEFGFEEPTCKAELSNCQTNTLELESHTLELESRTVELERQVSAADRRLLECGAQPSAEPTVVSPCADNNTAVAGTGADCATLAALGYCDAYLCTTCPYAGVCDASCGYCSSSPSTGGNDDACADYDAEVLAATGGYDCATMAAYAQCDVYLCRTCPLAGLCGAACGYCSSETTSAPTISTPPSL